MKFDMNQAWSRGVELVRDNFQLLAVIAGIFILLPTVALYFLVPGMEMFADPTADPEIVQAKILEVIGPLIGFGIVGSIIQFIGYCAMVALMGAGRPTVGQALATGFKSVLTIFAALLVFIVIYMLAAIVIVAPISLLAGVAGAPGLAAIAPILILGLMLFLMTRLSLTMPVVVIEGMLNPLGAMKRSWDLTRPSQWRVLGFWLVLGIAYMVISLLLLGVFGVVAAMVGTGSGSTLILGLVNGIISLFVAMIICGLAVAIYSQLAGPSEEEITSTFE